MSEIEDLLKDIEILRKQMEALIERHQGKLTDPEVIAASQILNAALNQYNKILAEKLKE